MLREPGRAGLDAGGPVRSRSWGILISSILLEPLRSEPGGILYPPAPMGTSGRAYPCRGCQEMREVPGAGISACPWSVLRGGGRAGKLSSVSGCAGLRFGDIFLCTPTVVVKTFVGGGNHAG